MLMGTIAGAVMGVALTWFALSYPTARRITKERIRSIQVGGMP